MTSTSRRIAQGAGWIYGFRWLDRLLAFAGVVVLARLLDAEDFGLVAIAASYVAIVEGLSSFDVGKALIRTREESRSLFDTAWTLSCVRGLATALLIVAVSPWVGDPRIASVLRALALAPLLGGIANPRFVQFERDLVYSRVALLTLTAKILSTAVTIYVAVAYRTYWALVLGTISNSLISTVLTYVLKPYRPRVSWSRVSDLLAFSGWMSLAGIVTTVSMQTDRIIVGRLLGIPQAGSYFMTLRVGALPTGELVQPLQRILFPSFSRITEDAERLRRTVVESINVLASLSLPAACGFALVANDLVPLALGERWLHIVPLLVVLVPFLGLRATLSMTQACVMALGQTRLIFRASAAYALVHLPAFIAGTAYFGLRGAIWSIVLAGFYYSYLNAWMLRQTLGISLVEILSRMRRPAAATLAMTGAVFAASRLPGIELFGTGGSLTALAVKIVLGGAVLCGVQYALWRLEGRPPGIERRLLQAVGR